MFKRILQILPVVCLATSVAWMAENPFVGVWKLDPSKSRMPDEMKVQSKGANKYAFDFGGSAEMITVDGSDQPGLGGTLLSVQPQAPDTWIVKRKQGDRLLLNVDDDGPHRRPRNAERAGVRPRLAIKSQPFAHIECLNERPSLEGSSP